MKDPISTGFHEMVEDDPPTADEKTETPKANGRDARPDVEERLRNMCFGAGGDGINNTLTSCTASDMCQGDDIKKIIVPRYLQAVQSYAATHPDECREWKSVITGDWSDERRTIASMCYRFVNKRPDLAPTMPLDMAIEHSRIEHAGGKPILAEDRSHPEGWWVFSETPIPPEQPRPKSGWLSYSRTAAVAAMKWAVKRILMQRGITTLSGQWGTYKTTVALYIAFALMTGKFFAERYRIKRRGAVLYYAIEGRDGILGRLRAIAESQDWFEDLPFKYRGDCPPLKEPTSVVTLCRHFDEAQAELRAEFGADIEITSVWFDTWARASGADEKGDDDDKGVTGAILRTLMAVEAHTKCVLVPLDHFGKDVSRGTRGSSDKESIDGLLACLGERGISGPVTKTRLAIRKVKDAEAGFEIPFAARIVETDIDEDGEAITAILIDWGQPQDGPVPVSKLKPNVELLRTSVETAVAAEGQPLERSRGSVMAVPVDAVRKRFDADFKPARGKTVAPDTLRKYFDDALAADTDGIGRRTTKGVTWLWRNVGKSP